MLSARLKRISDRVLPDEPLWDIGCDHGYLGLHALRSGICREVNLVDRSAEVLRRTRRRIDEWYPGGPPPGLHVWHTDAMQAPLPIVRGTVVIAGVGHATVLGILCNLFDGQPADDVQLVVGGAADEERVRLGLARRGWRLRHEELYVECRRVRQVIACGGDGEILDPFWNASSNSADNGLLGRFLSERADYYRSCRALDGDTLVLCDSLLSILGARDRSAVPHDPAR